MQRKGPGIDWKAACVPLQSLNKEICPSGQELQQICSKSYKTELNPSVRYEYCEPLFSTIGHSQDRVDCVRACVKYSSRDKGDCCEFKCE